MTLVEVQTDIDRLVDALIEKAPTDELRDLAVELQQDLASTGHTFAWMKHKQRGRDINRLSHRNALLERENRILANRLDAIGNLAVMPLLTK